MPEFEDARGFPSEKDHLPRVPFGSWGKFVFASLLGSFPLDDLVRDMDARCGWMPIDRCAFDASRSRDYLVRSNWALYVDNYLEGFHIPYVHAGLSNVLDYGSYRNELFRWSNLQLGVASGAEDVFDLPRESPDHGQRIAAYYFWLFPNTMFNFYPWGISVNVVRPLAVDLTKVSFLSYVWDASRLDRGAGATLDRVEREDEVIVETVQRGVRSRLYDRGRYSPKRESGVHHFHRLLAAALNGG
jgi:choline monooxygenase